MAHPVSAVCLTKQAAIVRLCVVVWRHSMPSCAGGMLAKRVLHLAWKIHTLRGAIDLTDRVKTACVAAQA